MRKMIGNTPEFIFVSNNLEAELICKSFLDKVINSVIRDGICENVALVDGASVAAVVSPWQGRSERDLDLCEFPHRRLPIRMGLAGSPDQRAPAICAEGMRPVE